MFAIEGPPLKKSKTWELGEKVYLANVEGGMTIVHSKGPFSQWEIKEASPTALVLGLQPSGAQGCLGNALLKMKKWGHDNLLGKALDPSEYEFQDLRTTFIFNMFVILCGDYDKFVKPENWSIRDEEVKGLVYWALEVEDTTPLPQAHKNPRHEGSLALVLMDRYKDKGCKLSGITYGTSPKFVEFSIIEEKGMKKFKHNMTGKWVEVLTIGAQFEAIDWGLPSLDNFSWKTARYFSKNADLAYGVAKLFQKKYGKDCFRDYEEAFEFPNAADVLEQESSDALPAKPMKLKYLDQNDRFQARAVGPAWPKRNFEFKRPSLDWRPRIL
jgi:hypothetical protein